MRSIISLFFLIFVSYSTFSQGNNSLSAEEKAYFFHTVRKSPILENNMGRYLEYNGPLIQFSNLEINYDSVESIIINHPELLHIRQSEIAKSPKGLLSEAANKMALWELNKVLLAKRNGEKELEPYLSKFKRFETILIPLLPPAACKKGDDGYTYHPKLDLLLNPSMSFVDKRELIGTFHFLNISEQLQTLEALNAAINKYVEERTFELFLAMGGRANSFKNVLLAAGDGSSTSGLLEEREKDEKGRWNKGLPKAVGFFTYQMKIQPADKKNKEIIEPLRFPGVDFETVGNNHATNIHCDVWGYNADKQTTVVIEKNGLSYHLFGSGETRFLSPDSSFSKGGTFQSLMNDLKRNQIDKLYEMIYGKKGFDYWIQYYTDKREAKLLEILKNENALSDLRMSTIVTSKKAKKKRGQKPQVQTYSGKKDRKKRQELLVRQHAELKAIEKKIEDLKKDKQQAIDLMAVFQLKYDTWQEKIGRNWAKWTEKDGLYTFQDSSTFDMLTQEFKFPPTEKPEAFEIRLLAIPYGVTTDQADEVMLHINVSEIVPEYDARVQLALEDLFDSDSWSLEGKQLFSEQDSVSLMVFFDALKDKKIPFKIIARGQGVGKWNGAQVKRMNNPEELSAYPGNTNDERMRSREDTTFKRLRYSEVKINLNRKIDLEVNSYTDPVKSNIQFQTGELQEFMSKNKLSKNDMLSALRTAEILSQLKTEINLLAGTYLDRETAKIVIDRFNNEYNKTRVSVGKTSIKLSALLGK
jgi:hypothetical protein